MERRVRWFDGVLFGWEISREDSNYLTVSSSLKAGRRNLYVSSLCTCSSGGWVTRYIMINDSEWDMIVGEGILLILPFHSVLYAQVHMNVLIFVLINNVKLMISLVQSSDTPIFSLYHPCISSVYRITFKWDMGIFSHLIAKYMSYNWSKEDFIKISWKIYIWQFQRKMIWIPDFREREHISEKISLHTR